MKIKYAEEDIDINELLAGARNNTICPELGYNLFLDPMCNAEKQKCSLGMGELYQNCSKYQKKIN